MMMMEEPQYKKYKIGDFLLEHPKNITIKKILCGAGHTFFICADNTIWSCGYNSHGQLGLGDTKNRSIPTCLKTIFNDDVNVTIKKIICGGTHTFLICEDNTIWSCGCNNNGQLGLGDTNNRLVPTCLKTTFNDDFTIKKNNCFEIIPVSRKMEKFIEPYCRCSNLIKAEDCFVLVIDVQETFMRSIVGNISKLEYLKKLLHLIKVCAVLNMPCIITLEDIEKNGTFTIYENRNYLYEESDSEITKLLENECISIFEKCIYSCWGQENIQHAIIKTKKNVAIICGFETDVCVCQTAIDLLDNQFKVMTLVDLTYSRNKLEHKIGLERMKGHGAILSSLKTWQEEITAGVSTKINSLIQRNKLSDI